MVAKSSLGMEPESSENFCTVEIDLTTPPPLPPGPAPVQIDIVNITTQQTASASQTSPIVAGTGRLASLSQDSTIVSSKRKSLAASILGPITDKLIKRHSSSGTADSQTIPTTKSLGKSSQGIGWWVGLFAYIFAFAIFVPMTIVALVANDGLMPVDDVTLTPGVMQGIRQAHMMNDSQVYDNFTASVASLYIRNEDQNLTDAIFTNVLRSELGLIYPTLIQFDATLKAGAYQTVNQTREAGYPAAAGIPGFSAVIQGTLASQGVTAVVFLQMVENGIARATIASAERHDVSRNDKIVSTGIQVGTAMQRAYHLSPEDIYQTAANAYLDELQDTGLALIFYLCLSGCVITLAVVLVFVFLVTQYRAEPEIRSRHKNFLVQFFLGTILCPIVLAVQLSAAFGYMTRDYQAMNITYNVTGFIVASLAILGPISAVILRQRFMFGVFKQRTRHSHYFITLPWHVFLNLFIIGVFTFCAIEPENCPVWKRYVPIFVTVVSFALEFIYYTWNVRNASGMFVDIWQSARLLLVWSVTFFGGYIATAFLDDNILSLIVICFQLCFLITGGVIDLFLLPVIKIFFRRRGYKVLDDIDLEGRAKHKFDVKRVDMVLADPEYRHLLLKFATERHCSENVAFLIEVENVRTKSSMTDKSGMDQDWKNEIASDIEHIGLLYVFEDSEQELNLSSRCRKNTVARLRGDLSAYTACEMVGVLSAAEKEIRDMVRSNLLGDFQKDPEVNKVMERRLRAVENMTILASHGLIITSTTKEETDSEKSDATRA